MQVYAGNFKQKKNKASSFRYSCWRIRIYKLEDVKLMIMSTLEKKRRREDEWLATPSHTKKKPCWS